MGISFANKGSIINAYIHNNIPTHHYSQEHFLVSKILDLNQVNGFISQEFGLKNKTSLRYFKQEEILYRKLCPIELWDRLVEEGSRRTVSGFTKIRRMQKSKDTAADDLSHLSHQSR